MNMIDIITSIFSPKVAIDIHNEVNAGCKFLQIDEEGEFSDIKKLTVNNLPDDCFAITLDIPQKNLDDSEKIAYSRLNHYFDKSNSVGLNKKCDLIIFAKLEEEQCVVVFDLKSKDPKPDASAKQLLNSEIYVRYVLDVAATFYDFDISCIKIIKVIGTTRIRKNISHIDIERIEKIKKRKNEFLSCNIKEVKIIKKANNNGVLNFNEMVRL
ncbi:hypothetical protein [Dickeya zeae]|uniref:hypothetical protein n=1 Tax=Dickeya zeae TaxID=204042 RepID=UPI0014401EEA|nr:hypothetical protein [Dickeya zeae]QIZ46585.1 hypothetical protein DWV07_06625 [Dickeya zeae]